MRRPLRLPTIALPLAIAGTLVPTHAEAAWVLWSVIRSGGIDGALTPRATYATKPTCEAAVRAEITKTKAKWMNEQPTPGVPRLVEVFEDAGWTLLRDSLNEEVHGYSCLPDTIDPRGPKGGQ
jgi:hypothetical protein